MTKLVYTAAAERDLTQISLYIGADSLRAARRFVARVWERCTQLAQFPEMGPPRSNIGLEVRSLTQGSYVIYYRRLEILDEVRILRIWHGRRKLPTAAELL